MQGWSNVLLLGVIVGLVLMSGLWKSPVHFHVYGAEVGLPDLVRDIGLLAVIVLSLRITAPSIHADNQFGWGPMQEVAKLFAGIFLTITPVIAMLKAGTDGPFAAVVHAVTGADGKPIPVMYFWATGLLSSFLDNAPTYLVFFNTAGGNAQVLMNEMAHVLMAISAGAVFMGGLHLHRQCAQPDGQGHCRRPGHPHAQLLRLSVLVTHLPAALFRASVAVQLPVRGADPCLRSVPDSTRPGPVRGTNASMTRSAVSVS